MSLSTPTRAARKSRGLVHDLTGIDFERATYKLYANVCIILSRLFMKMLHLIGVISINVSGGYMHEKQYIPPIGNRPILRESLTKVTERIRNQEVTAEEVVRTFIQRAYEVNRQLNCIVSNRFNEALEEAREADRLIQSGAYTVEELRAKFPLLGIPFSIKDFYYMKGLKNTAGVYGRRDMVAPDDADVIKTLRKAGAIPFGVTNVSELCMWWETVNPIYGRSNNPYDTRRTPGGSSGGEAALQSVAGSGFGVGSDLGGSVRIPAFFCGLYGHKPTRDLVSNAGHDPPTASTIAEYLTTGNMVRHAEDLELVLKAMAAPNIKLLREPMDLRRIRLYYMEHDGGSPLITPVSREMKQALLRSVHFLETQLGIRATRVTSAQLPGLYHSAEIWSHGISNAGVPSVCDELGMRRRKVNPFLEIIKLALGRSHHTFPVMVLGIIEKIEYWVNRNTSRPKNMIALGHELRKDLQALLGQNGILLYPTHPSTAPKHYEAMFHPGDFSYCAIFNVLGVPSTQVPLGLGRRGLPLGVQVVGPNYSDFTTIKIAELLEKGFHGWVPPCSSTYVSTRPRKRGKRKSD